VDGGVRPYTCPIEGYIVMCVDVLDAVWMEEYDPIHVLLRATYKRDYVASMDRFTEQYVTKYLINTSQIVRVLSETSTYKQYMYIN